LRGRVPKPFQWTMSETLVELAVIPVLKVQADWKGAGPPAAFAKLESKLPSLKGRKFYGMFWPPPPEERYFACVAREESDDPEKLGLEVGEVPGGWYARRRIRDWEKHIPQIPVEFQDMIRVLGDQVDPSRPGVEFYRSQAELFVLLPVKAPTGTRP
jgi:hypothetical protein